MATVGLGPTNISAHAGSGMGIFIDMDPSPLLLVAQFDKLGLDIRSFKEPLKRSVQKVVAPSLRKNFDQQGRPDRWPELADQTVAQKAAQGFTATSPFPLVRTGKLRQRAQELQTWDIDGLEGTAVLRVPEDVWYGKVHQEGSNESGIGSVEVTTNRRTGRKRTVTRGVQGYVPQRIWAIIQDEDEEAIEDVFEKWLQERLLANGFVAV